MYQCLCASLGHICPHREPPLKTSKPSDTHSELPVLVDRLDSPIKLLPQSLREEALDGHVKLLGEDNGEARIDVVLPNKSVAILET